MQFILLGLLLCASLHSGQVWMYSQWTAFSIAAPFVVLFIARKSLNTYFERLLAFTGAFGFIQLSYLLICQNERFALTSMEVKSNLATFAAIEFFMVLSPLFLFGIIPLPDLRKIKWSLGAFCLLASIYTLIGAFVGFGKPLQAIGFSGIIDNPSHNGCLLACLTPFLTYLEKGKGFLFLPIAILAIYLSHASVPIGALAVALFVMCSTWNRFSIKKRFFFAVLIAAVLIGVGRFHDDQLFDSALRFPAWKSFMPLWWNTANLFTGFGPGSWSVLIPNYQLVTGFGINYTVNPPLGYFWTFAHNEWLQTLFEFGVIGLVLAVLIFVKCLLIFFKNNEREALASSLALGGSLCFNYTTRFVPCALLLGFLIAFAFKLERAAGNEYRQ